MKKLLIVAAVVLPVATCIGSDYALAFNRSRQKRTMGTILHTVQQFEAYREKHHTYPRAGYFGPIATNDAWGRPLLYHATADHYALRSTARDGINDHKTIGGQSESFDADIVLADGSYLRAPPGFCGGGGPRETDRWDASAYGSCAECHPHRVRDADLKAAVSKRPH